MPLLRSPLAAPRIQQVFLGVGLCLMPKDLHYLGTWVLSYCIGIYCLRILSQLLPLLSLLAMLVGHVTLRLLKPECDLDKAWEQEDLDTAAHRTVLLLHNHTAPQREAKTGGELSRRIHIVRNI